MTDERSLRMQEHLRAVDICFNSMVVQNSTNAVEKKPLTTRTNLRKPKLAEPPKVIYVNPNYGIRKHVIHVNPNVHSNVSIHVNPQLNSQISTSMNPNVCSKTSIYVNPKIVKNRDVMEHINREENRNIVGAENSESNIVAEKVQNSIYVNPKLLQQISSVEAEQKTEKKVVTERICYNVGSKFNVKSVTPKKSTTSNIISFSSRTLGRLKRNSKGSSNTLVVSPNKIRRISATGLKLTVVNENTSLGTASHSCQTNNRLKICKFKNKVGQYNVDKTVVQRGKTKHSELDRKKILNNSMKLVSIGGISYKSSKNQLVRRTSTSPTKRKRIISNKVHDQFFIASNGKALHRIDSTRKCLTHINPTSITVNLNRTTLVRRKSIALVKPIFKNNIINKVKQRSIQILRNKLRKNNQPCLFFQKFGYCANQVKGTCHKVHDKKQVALCKRFLQGKCMLDNCGLSHDVGPEKMPTCKYFLEGCCTRDTCPYVHVKVSSNTPICREFLQGYCKKGEQCEQRHIYKCPEFEKTGICSKGKYCPYPHKSKAPKISGNLQKQKDCSLLKLVEPTVSTIESRKRYYNSNEDHEKKKENILKKIKIMQSVHKAGQSEESITDLEVSSRGNSSESINERDVRLERPKRPPIGPLPSYIPIN